jgi:hypothetical protein
MRLELHHLKQALAQMGVDEFDPVIKLPPKMLASGNICWYNQHR